MSLLEEQNLLAQPKENDSWWTDAVGKELRYTLLLYNNKFQEWNHRKNKAKNKKEQSRKGKEIHVKKVDEH